MVDVLSIEIIPYIIPKICCFRSLQFSYSSLVEVEEERLLFVDVWQRRRTMDDEENKARL